MYSSISGAGVHRRGNVEAGRVVDPRIADKKSIRGQASCHGAQKVEAGRLSSGK